MWYRMGRTIQHNSFMLGYWLDCSLAKRYSVTITCYSAASYMLLTVAETWRRVWGDGKIFRRPR